MGGRVRPHHGLVVAMALVAAACGDDGRRIDASFGNGPVTTASTTAEASDTTIPPPSTTPSPSTSDANPSSSAATTSTADSTTTSTTATPTTSSTTTSTTATPTTSSTTTSTTATPTTSSTTTSTTLAPAVGLVPAPAPIGPTGVSPREPADPGFAATNAAFEVLAGRNLGATLTVTRGGEIVLSRAAGPTVAGDAATGDTPAVVASVSKLVSAVAIARLVQADALSDDDAVPWGEIGILPHPAWLDVTIRELMEHSAGVPVARTSWFRGQTDCPTHVQSLLGRPPMTHRGEWTYSNGNYCILGLVIEARTGLALDEALQHLVFDPIGAQGVHLTDDGLLPGDMPHPHGAGVARLSRLGAAGNLLVSTDDLALAIGRLTPADRQVMTPSTLFTDQYGFGHTGTIDGAKACVWALDGGETVVAATVAGDSPYTGGGVCDRVVPALARDLGIGGTTQPDRTP